jgi:hypothetical protein
MSNQEETADPVDQFIQMLADRRQQRIYLTVDKKGHWSGENKVLSFRAFVKRLGLREYLMRRRSTLRRSIKKRIDRLARKFRKQDYLE